MAGLLQEFLAFDAVLLTAGIFAGVLSAIAYVPYICDQQLIDGPVTVTLATQASDRVQLNAMWFEASPDRTRVHINTVKGRAKDRHLRESGTPASRR